MSAFVCHIKRIHDWRRSTHALPTLCKPEDETFGIVCAYITAEPGETLASVRSRAIANTAPADCVALCAKCETAMAA